MTSWSRGLDRLRRILGIDVADEVESELEFHLLMRARDLEAAGLSPSAARERAEREFGDYRVIERECRAIAERRNRTMRRTEWLGEFRQDVRFGLRQFLRSPGFTLVAVLTLALGIGANSAIFTVINAVLLRPLEYRAPQELVFVHSQFPTLGFDKFWISPPEYRDLQGQMRTLQSVGGWRTGSTSLSGLEAPLQVTGASVTADFFTTLGVAPRLGRTFTAEEDVPDGPRVVVISERLWRSAFQADPGVVGRSVEVDGRSAQIVGVMPAGFDIEDAGVDSWEPMRIPANPTNRGSHYLNLVARLAPGATVEQARGELRGLVGRWEEVAGEESHAPHPEFHPVRLKPLRDEVVGEVRTPLLILLGAVGLVLLIACGNVANLLLAKAEARQKEIAVRAALGAGRGRLARQLLTESVLLAVSGGALGLALGYGGLRALLAISPDSLPRAAGIGLDGRVVLFTLAVSVLTGVLFGLAPLLHLGHRTMAASLRDGGQRSTATGARKRLRVGLMVAEVALAVVLVIGSGLLLRSLAVLHETDPGFEPGGVLTFRLFLPESRYPEAPSQVAFFAGLTERLGAIPGVQGVAAMSGLPPQREVNANDTEFEGVQQTDDGPAHNVDYYQSVHGDYFRTMGIPILQGRGFTPGDDARATPVVVIGERLARVFYPGQNPLGRRMRPCCGDDYPWFTIVGVARDVKQGGLSEQSGTELYFHYPQVASEARTMNVVVRTARDPLALAQPARDAVWSLDPALPLAGVQTMEQNIADSTARPRLLTTLLAIFAALALLLAAVGTYGVLSYAVAERSKEIAIRMALGAGAQRVKAMVLRDGLVVAGIGLVLGLGGALALTRLMRSMLFGVSSVDAVTFLAAPLVLVVVALLASYLPARRATRVDPMVSLRAE